jgi:hypothetical protein
VIAWYGHKAVPPLVIAHARLHLRLLSLMPFLILSCCFPLLFVLSHYSIKSASALELRMWSQPIALCLETRAVCPSGGRRVRKSSGKNKGEAAQYNAGILEEKSSRNKKSRF